MILGLDHFRANHVDRGEGEPLPHESKAGRAIYIPTIYDVPYIRWRDRRVDPQRVHLR